MRVEVRRRRCLHSASLSSPSQVAIQARTHRASCLCAGSGTPLPTARARDPSAPQLARFRVATTSCRWATRSCSSAARPTGFVIVRTPAAERVLAPGACPSAGTAPGARGAGRGGAGDSRHLSPALEPGLVRTPGAREGAALRPGRGARAAPAAAAEELGEERGGGAQGGGEGEGGGARRVPCKAALFIWAQPQPPRWEAQGGRSSPTGELRSGLCREGPGAGRSRALLASPAPRPPPRWAARVLGSP